MSQKFHNTKKLEKIRRRLRQNQTRPEILLWSRIRNKRTGYKFRRQHSIGPFIVDFYCPQLRLIVELDGPVHFEEYNIRRDRRRESFLLNRGFNILRFHTEKVMRDVETVFWIIKDYCDELNFL